MDQRVRNGPRCKDRSGGDQLKPRSRQSLAQRHWAELPDRGSNTLASLRGCKEKLHKLVFG